MKTQIWAENAGPISNFFNYTNKMNFSDFYPILKSTLEDCQNCLQSPTISPGYVIRKIDVILDGLENCEGDQSVIAQTINHLRQAQDLLEQPDEDEKDELNIKVDNILVLLKYGFKVTEISAMYGVHRNTIHNRLRSAGTSVST